MTCPCLPFDVRRATREFHRTFGMGVRHDPHMDQVVVRFRLERFAEELAEYHDAVAAGDIIETADALADMLYTLHGDAWALGLAPVHLAPATASTWPGDITVGFLFGAYADALADRDVVEAAVTHAVLEAGIRRDAAQLGLPLDALLAEVHRSNMTKHVEDDEAAARQDVKVRKGAEFVEPDIAAVLDRHARHRTGQSPAGSVVDDLIAHAS